MGLITKEVQVRVNGSIIKYYENLGYNIPKKENGRYDTQKYLTVNVDDLPKSSRILVTFSCDYCGELITQPYFVYYREIQGIVPKNCCEECNHLKVQESNMITYNTNSVLKLKDVQDKIHKTIKERYDVDYISQSSEIKKRIEETNLSRYGTTTPCQNPEIKAKIISTNNERYGSNSPMQNKDIQEKSRNTTLLHYNCENVSQVESIKEKKCDTQFTKYGMLYNQTEECKERIKNTCLNKYNSESYLGSQKAKSQIKKTNYNKYGYENPFEAPEIKEKIKKTRYEHGNICTSRQQLYINNLFGMKLNYPIIYWNVDMYDEENNIICEYDGGAHNLSVKLGSITEEEFIQKEIIRNNMMKRAGYKIIRIISRQDKLPSDEILLQMLEDAKQYFSDYPNHSWMNFDIDNGILRNAEHKDGIPYFYGNLRKIKKEQLQSA